MSIITLLARFVGTISGFGTATLMMPVLLFFMPLPETLLLVGIIHWFGNIWKLALFREGLRLKLVLLFGIPGISATFLGAKAVFAFPSDVLVRYLGGFFIAYVLFLLLRPKFRFKQSGTTAIAGGALSGFFSGIFGVGGAVRGVFLSVFDLPKAVYIATIGAIGLFVDSTRVIAYFLEGVSVKENLLLGLLLFVPISLVGAYFAKRAVNKIPQKHFRLVIAIFLLLVGVKFFFFP